ncbi:Biotin-protein ligase [Pseudoalteromonas luteoviolacea B = ATCC 29581]|nr:Biotin-protein ligase [Pseudoalteromonas luteoviolacea B = ATCC 29581]
MKAQVEGNKLKVLEALNLGGFVSGQALGVKLGISRTAVAKHITSLQEMGIDIFTVSGKGYCLNHSLPLLQTQKINEALVKLQDDTRRIVEVVPVIDSTNTELMRRIQAKAYPNSGHTLLAEMQQAGRGRRGKVWQSPFGANLYLSYYWRLEDGMQAAMGVSVVVGLALYDAIKALYGIDVQLKWPNDVYLDKKKLAGILVELDGQMEGPCHLVIGIGVNLVMPQSAASAIDQPWQDLSSKVGKIDKNALAAMLIVCLAKRLTTYRESGLKTFSQQWNSLNVFKGKSVRLSTGTQTWQGICEGINEQGALLLRCDGEVKAYFGGELSLRAVDSN